MITICSKCAGRVDMNAFSKGICEICGKEFDCSHTPADKICPECSENEMVCSCCGRSLYKDVNLETKFPRKWKVIDRETKEVNNEVLVLDPNNRLELEVIKHYAKLAPRPLCDLLEDWVEGYEKNRCLQGRRCKITNSPICCCYCPHKGSCMELEKSPICGLAATDTVSSNQECLEEPMV